MIRHLYFLSTFLAHPFLGHHIRRRAKRGKEDAGRLNERFGEATTPRPDGRLLWIHGASVGETLSALPLIHTFLDRSVDLHILVTSGTVTSAQILEDRLPERAFHQFVPIDTPAATRKFLENWRPDAVIWLESEFWPNLLAAVAKNRVPLALVNGRLSQNSYKNWRRAPAMIKFILGCFDLILTQSEADLNRFKKLGAQKATFAGNLKDLADPLPADPDLLASMHNHLGDRPLWLAASTHPGEEAATLKVHCALKQSIPNLLTIIVPRHPERGDQISQSIKTLGLNFARRSQNALVSEKTEVYLGDSLGELGIFYRLSRLAFIGGSLEPHGGHNPLEACRLGTAVLFGPHMENFTEISSRLIAANAAHQVKNIDDLQQQVHSLLDHPTELNAMSAAGLELCEQDQNNLPLIVDQLNQVLHLFKTPEADR